MAKKARKVISKAQAGLLGAVAAGKSTKASGLSKKAAKEKLRGVEVEDLPQRVVKRKGK